MKLQFKKGDMVAVLLVLALGLAVLLAFLPGAQKNGASAEVYLDGQLIRVVSLQEDVAFTVEGDYCNTITVKNGKIAVTHANCPGKDCVGIGWQSHSGRSLVCLPNRLEIRIVSEKHDVDFVVG